LISISTILKFIVWYIEPGSPQGRLKNDAGTSDRLDLQDNKVLEDMIEQLGQILFLRYFFIFS